MAALAILIGLGVRIFVAAGVVGFCGLWALLGFTKAVGIAGHIPYSDTTNYALSVLPLFILIGHLAHHAGIVQGAYRCARAWLGWLPGGLGIATVFAAAGFAAVSGASTATAAVFSRIALPELLRYKYQPGFAAAVVAAGGTLASLDPAVRDHGRLRDHYRDLDRRSAARRVHTWRHLGAASIRRPSWGGSISTPRLASRASADPWQERWTTLPEVAPIVMVIGVVIGGMYTGWATPTEVGALGAFIIFVMALLRRMMSGRALLNSLIDTAKLSVMIFSIIWGVLIFVRFLAFAGISASFQAWILALGVSPYLVLFCVILLYIVLGMFMDGIGMLLLTLPVIHPVMINLGFNSIWFGIIVVKMVEVGLLTPPVGLNCYVVAGVRPDIPLQQIFRGIWPFVIADLICVLIFTLFPVDRDLPAKSRARRIMPDLRSSRHRTSPLKSLYLRDDIGT